MTGENNGFSIIIWKLIIHNSEIILALPQHRFLFYRLPQGNHPKFVFILSACPILVGISEDRLGSESISWYKLKVNLNGAIKSLNTAIKSLE